MEEDQNFHCNFLFDQWDITYIYGEREGERGRERERKRLNMKKWLTQVWRLTSPRCAVGLGKAGDPREPMV